MREQYEYEKRDVRIRSKIEKEVGKVVSVSVSSSLEKVRICFVAFSLSLHFPSPPVESIKPTGTNSAKSEESISTNGLKAPTAKCGVLEPVNDKTQDHAPVSLSETQTEVTSTRQQKNHYYTRGTLGYIRVKETKVIS